MRYRPFARTGMAVSALSLALDGADEEASASDWRDLVHTAFEEGVNTFELVRPTSALLEGFGEGAASVNRNLIFVSLVIAADAEPRELPKWVMGSLAKARLEAVNLVCLEAGDVAAPAPALISLMRQMKDRGLAERLAISGPGEAIEEPVRSGLFDAIVTPFNLLSGWRERHLIRTVLERQMGVIGCDPCPDMLGGMVEEAEAVSKPGWGRKRASPLAGVGTYAFLQRTPGWTVEQLCVGYALTEPSLATVQVRAADPKHLVTLAGAAERDLPAAVSAQIEMARFSVERAAGTERRSKLRTA